MIAKLRGIIEQIHENSIVIDVSGVGYLVHSPIKVINKLANKGEIDSLIIETIVREDQITLYGFKDEQEKYWFNLLLKVQGVGAKTALNTLSVFTPQELENIITLDNKSALTQIAGIGMRGASRICSELKDKTINIISNNDDPSKNKNIEDLISALVGLGYSPHETYAVISKMDIQDKNKKVEEMIQITLKMLAERKNK